MTSSELLGYFIGSYEGNKAALVDKQFELHEKDESFIDLQTLSGRIDQYNIYQYTLNVVQNGVVLLSLGDVISTKMQHLCPQDFEL